MIYGLRRYDEDRCAALVDTSDPADAGVKVRGFMSHKSKIYLVGFLHPSPGHSLTMIFMIQADVYDHIDYILSSLDMFALIAENLIQYTFNVSRSVICYV
jgi:hypothetical protein